MDCTTGPNSNFGFGARAIALIDAAAASPFAQLSMIPLLTLIAYYAPPARRATWFALMASLMNMALVAGQLQTKYLNQVSGRPRRLRRARPAAGSSRRCWVCCPARRHRAVRPQSMKSGIVPAMRRLTRPLWILLALIFLFEAWLWEHLPRRCLGRRPVSRWAKLKARVAARDRASAALPDPAHLPGADRSVVPPQARRPVDAGARLVARRHAVLALAKVMSMGVAAFIFDVTRPKLLQLPWFRWLYDHVLVWLAWAHGLIDPIKAEMRAWTSARRPAGGFRRIAWLMKPRRAGRFLRRLAWLRRRMQQREQGQVA